MAPLPSLLKATHEPKASAGLISTPLSMTWRSFLGMLNRNTSPGCTCPGRPIASSTFFQSLAAAFGGGLAACPAAKVQQSRKAIAPIVRWEYDKRLWKASLYIVFILPSVMRQSLVGHRKPGAPLSH